MTEEQAHATGGRATPRGSTMRATPFCGGRWKRSVAATTRTGQSFAYGHVVDSLLNEDPYMVLADFASYIAAQDTVEAGLGRPADGAAWWCTTSHARLLLLGPIDPGLPRPHLARSRGPCARLRAL
jgi:hypothetical protein